MLELHVQALSYAQLLLNRHRSLDSVEVCRNAVLAGQIQRSDQGSGTNYYNGLISRADGRILAVNTASTAVFMLSQMPRRVTPPNAWKARA